MWGLEPMRNKTISWLRYKVVASSGFLPESRFKDFLRRQFYRRLNPLYRLSEIVNKMELQGKELLVELNNGIRYYGHGEEALHPLMKYGDPVKLREISQFRHFCGLLGTICEQYVEDVYGRYYELRDGDIVIDAGAHVGVYTVKAAKAVGKLGMVIAIEPEANNLYFLKRNIAANGLKNVIVVPKGLWDHKDKLRLQLSKISTSAHSLFTNPSVSSEFEVVEVDTLDNILNELGIKRVDFVKMDIEGAETVSLTGMAETLQSNNTLKLAIAAYHTVGGKTTAKTIASKLKNRDFEIRAEAGIVYAAKRV